MTIQYFVHVGMPKTGSTFLQENVFPYFENVDFWHSSRTTLSDLVFRSTHNKILISHESFQGAVVNTSNYRKSGWMVTREARLVMLSGMFPDANVILIVRRHGDWLSSMYRQYLHQGGVARFEEFFSPQVDLLVDRMGLDYRTLIKCLKQKFSGKLLCINYEALRTDLPRVIQAIELFLEEKRTREIDNRTYNTSVRRLQAQLLRFVNRYSESSHYIEARHRVFFRHNDLFHRSKLAPGQLLRRFSFLGHFASDVVSPEQISAANAYYSTDWEWVLEHVGHTTAVL